MPRPTAPTPPMPQAFIDKPACQGDCRTPGQIIGAVACAQDGRARCGEAFAVPRLVGACAADRIQHLRTAHHHGQADRLTPHQGDRR